MDRRAFFRTAGVGAASAGLLGACTDDDGASVRPADDPADATTGSPPGDPITPSAPTSQTLAFRGTHQAGVTAPPAAHGVVAAFDLRDETRDELRETLRTLSEATEQVMSGDAYEVRDGGFPPEDTGILGPVPGPTGTSIVVGFGDSLFDARFGLGEMKPIELQRMPKFSNDYLVQDHRSHGDLSIAVSADTADAVHHALRQLMRVTRGRLVPRWQKEGYNTLFDSFGPGEAPTRNLMGFKDGTSNPDPDDAAQMADITWVHDDDGQPDWAVGGTYQVIRIIRMQVEFWDRTRLNEQEAIFGRRRSDGAPLGRFVETDEPDFASMDPNLVSHIARANPRTAGSERNRILRRGFNYASGLDDNDQFDQGLIFLSFQRSLEAGFITVQRRLDGEVLEEYIRPLGGGFFFVPPAPPDGEFLGEQLLA